ncbi:sensor histidine kinase [Enterovibrio norvegicus]|uniref:sensor histidine kinase n=1 Tax=Enterovibrio norvegicus TaxID=188144 RepID=UPI00352E3964
MNNYLLRSSPFFCIKALAIALVSVCCLCSCKAQARIVQHYDVGVLALRGDNHANKAWRPTLDWLEQEIPGVTFELHPYNFDELDDAFRHNQLDFLLTSPGQATKIARQHQLNWLATQRTGYSKKTSRSIASVVVVRESSHFTSLKDIEQARVAAVSEKAFGGFIALRYELDKLDYFNASFYKKIKFTGPPTDQLIYDVIDNNIDVAVVPACTLENMAKEGLVDTTSVRVLDVRYPDGSVCGVSTPLYPNWTFTKTDRATNEIGKKVAQALLAMPEDALAAKSANNIGWTLPESPVDVDNVFKHLDMHPLQQTWQESFYKWLDRNEFLAFSTVLILILLNVYHLWVEYHFKRSKQELERTLFALKEKNAVLEHVQRTMIVGELGSSIAHEINQPLSSIKNYYEGVQRRIEQGMDPKDLTPILGKIQQQVGAASDIIQRLRSLIKRTPTARVVCRPVDFISDSIHLVEYDFRALNIGLELSVDGEPFKGEFDVIGMQQVMLNLLKNAKEACLASMDVEVIPMVHVELLYGTNEIIIKVEDNGIGLEASEEEVQQAFYTTKSDGLGLGLPICRDVVEAHHGQFMIQPNRPRGCQVTIVIPVTRSQE